MCCVIFLLKKISIIQLTWTANGSSIKGFSLIQHAWIPRILCDPDKGKEDRSEAFNTIKVESQTASNRSNAEADLRNVTGAFWKSKKLRSSYLVKK